MGKTETRLDWTFPFLSTLVCRWRLLPPYDFVFALAASNDTEQSQRRDVDAVALQHTLHYKMIRFCSNVTLSMGEVWKIFLQPHTIITVTFLRTKDFPLLDTQRHTPNKKGIPQHSPHAATLWESRVDAQSYKNKNYSDISEKDKAHFWVILNFFSWRSVYLKSGPFKPLHRQQWSPSLQFVLHKLHYTAHSCSVLWLCECLKIWYGNMK